MHPFRPRRRTRRDMIVLGGWLFADLLLGLAMIFLVANTVGAPPPTPTPTPTPDQLATAEASFAAAETENAATRDALENELAMAEQTAIAQENQAAAERLSATQTAEARATEAAMSEAELATRDALATEDAVVAQATIAAFSTEVAASDADQSQMAAELATISAQSTVAAEEVAAQSTATAEEIAAQSTRQAEIAAIATEQAASGADVQATLAALEESNQSSADELATAQANREQIEATATAFVDIAAPGSLSPNSVEVTLQVDLNGVIGNNDGAIDNAEEEILDAFQPYADAEGCEAGFVLTSSRAPELGQGVQLSDAMNDLLESTVPEVFGDTVFESIALPGTAPSGEVILQIFLYSGCEVLDDA